MNIPPTVHLSLDLGFAPDADPLRPGVAQDVFNFIPSERGLRALTEPENRDLTTAAPTVTAEVVVGYGYSRLDVGDNLTSEFAGTGTKLYARDYFGGTWSDESRTAGYTAAAAQCWTFERFGDYVVAAALPTSTGTIPLQASPLSQPASTPQFTDITAAPTCAVVTSAERFVLAFNGRGGFRDSWSCCARDDHTSWTASAATLAATGRLVDPPGPITAAIAFGNDVIAFKARAMVLGRFVPGDAEVWKWERLRFLGGAAGPRAVCKIYDSRVAFHNADSCYLFDGSQVVDVLDGRARAWFRRRRNQNTISQHGCAYESRTNSVWYTFTGIEEDGSGSSTVYGLVVNLTTGRIGRVELGADLVAEMVDPNLTTLRSVGYFDSSQHRQYAFSASNDATVVTTATAGFSGLDLPYVVTGDVGEPYEIVSMDSVRIDAPYRGSGTVALELWTRETRAIASERITIGSAESSGERFDARASGHWHRARIEAQTALELTGAWFRGVGLAGRRK